MDTAIMTGYMNEWNRYKCNLTQMAKHGYNSLIFAHANVHGRYVHMAQELLNTHTGREILSKDIETAKLCGAKYILITLGSMKDSFKIIGQLAQIAWVYRSKKALKVIEKNNDFLVIQRQLVN